MAQKERRVAVLTADIINSTGYSKIERREINRVLLKSFDKIAKLYPTAIHTPMGFRITAGDEFQCVFSNIPKAFEILTHLRVLAAISKVRPIIQFRASIGVGEISVTTKTNSYEEDGEAFVRSRRGLDQLDRGRFSLTRMVMGQSELDDSSNVVLLFMDDLLKGWTKAQWEAVRWSFLGLTREEIARKLRVAHQNVTKRLVAARWFQFRAGSDFLGRLLAQSAQQRSSVP